MRALSLPAVLFWVVAIATPVVTCAIIWGSLSESVKMTMETRIGGGITPYATPSVLWFTAIALTLCDLALAAGYAFNDTLHDLGVIAAIGRVEASCIFVVLAIVFNIVAIWAILRMTGIA